MRQVGRLSNIKDFEEVVKLAVAHIDNWTIWEDIKILLKMFFVAFTHRGAKNVQRI